MSITLYEYFRILRKTSKNRIFLTFYIIFFLTTLLHILLLNSLKLDSKDLLLTIGIASSISDVTAFFFGNFFGIHKLPSFVNPNKSWEGILGQIVGALIGALLIKLFIADNVNILLFWPIGAGSSVGDIINSYTKRKVGIRYWSNLLPGHGGVIDRFSSLSWSTIFTFYFLIIFSRAV